MIIRIFKEQFQIEKEVVVKMIKIEEKINLDALEYNLIRIYNIKQEIKKTHNKRFRSFCKSTQLKTN